MPTVIQIKSSETAGSVPTSASLAVAELAVNLTDKKLYSKTSGGTVVEIGGGAATSTSSFPSDWGTITDAVVSANYDFGSVTDAA